MDFRSKAILTLALLFSAAACGEVVPVAGDASPSGDGSSTDATPLGPCEVETIKIEDLQGCVFEAFCKQKVACQTTMLTVEACVEQFSSGGEGDLVRTMEAIEAGRATFDGTQAALCLATLDESNCNQEPSGEACDRTFTGTISDGGSCFDKNECSGLGAECAEIDGCNQQCCVGVCLDLAAEGGDCSMNRSCEPGFSCVFEDGSVPENVCRPNGDGATCLDSAACADSLYCGNNDTCVTRLGINADCINSTECASPLVCVGRFSVDGGSCTDLGVEGASCEVVCLGDFYCEPGINELGTCVPRLGLNSTCENDQQCQQQFICAPNLRECKPPPTFGMPCERYDCAQGFFCTVELPDEDPNGTGTCAEPMINGSECNNDDHCETDICIGGFCEAYASCYL